MAKDLLLEIGLGRSACKIRSRRDESTEGKNSQVA